MCLRRYGERIAKPAARGLQLAALVQPDEMQPVAMSSRTLSAAASTPALSKWQAAEPLPRSLNIVNRSPRPTVQQIPGVASPIGQPMTFGEGTGDPYLELPAGNKSRQALLDNRIGRFRLTRQCPITLRTQRWE